MTNDPRVDEIQHRAQAATTDELLRRIDWTHDAGVSACHYPGADGACDADDHYHADRGEIRPVIQALRAALKDAQQQIAVLERSRTEALNQLVEARAALQGKQERLDEICEKYNVPGRC